MDELIRTRLEEASGHLGAALMQASPRDDAIIVGHIRDAYALVLAALRAQEKEKRG